MHARPRRTLTGLCALQVSAATASAQDAPAPDFDMDRSFAELWAHPKLNGTFRLGDDSEVYATLSAGATQAIGLGLTAGL